LRCSANQEAPAREPLLGELGLPRGRRPSARLGVSMGVGSLPRTARSRSRASRRERSIQTCTCRRRRAMSGTRTR
jgi:hypothetical protein